MGGFSPVSIDQQSSWLDNMMDLNGNNKRYLICMTENDKPIGMAGLYGINWIHRTTEVGLYIGDKNEHRKGYAQSAYNLIEKYAANYLNLRKIKLQVVKSNSRAKNMWEKLNFKEVGRLSKERFIDGNYFDLLIMEKFLD